MTITLRTQLPDPLNMPLLKQQISAQWPDAIGASRVDKHTAPALAVYFPDDTAVTQSDVDTFVATHDGTQKTQAELNNDARRDDEDTVRAAIDARTFDAATEALARLVLNDDQ